MKRHKTTVLSFCTIFLLSLLVLFPQTGRTQTTLVTELSGNPPDFTDWTTVNIDTDGEEIILTHNLESQAGALFFSQPYNLNKCLKWKVEFDFRLYGGSPHADGMAFWFLQNPPTDYGEGQSLGMPNDSYGLKVAFDTYDNDNGIPGHQPNPEIQVYYGEGYDETFPSSEMLKSYAPNLNSPDYQHAVITWDEGEITIAIDQDTVLQGQPTPFDGVENIQEGYFGFSASTGLYHDRQSIKNVKVYVDVLALDQSLVNLPACDFDGDGFADFDLTSVEDSLIDNDEAVFGFYTDYDDALSGTDPLENPTDYVNTEPGADGYIYVRVANQNGCSTVGFIHLVLEDPPVPNTDHFTLPGRCDQEGDGIEYYDLTGSLSAIIDHPDEYDISFYTSQDGAINANPEDSISQPQHFGVAAGDTTQVYIKIENPENQTSCYALVTLTLQTYQMPVIQETVDWSKCGQGSFVFDLTQNNDLILGDQNREEMTISFYQSQQEADAGENPIENPEDYPIENGCKTIYVRLENNLSPDCYATDSFKICGRRVNAGAPEDFEACLIGDELGVFDLTAAEDEILENQEADDYEITFYTDQEDAEVPQNAIADPANYQAQTTEQQIYFRIENKADSSCFIVGSFEVITHPVEVQTGLQLRACAGENFDLTEIADDIALNDTEEIEGYYPSLQDAEAGNAIAHPSDYAPEAEVSAVYVVVNAPDQTCLEIYRVALEEKACQLFIPEGFSPNADGVNDRFVISNIDNYPHYSLKIYSRYGRLIYEGHKNDRAWDGNADNGKEMPSGVYYYVLNLKNENEVKKGWVYLNR